MADLPKTYKKLVVQRQTTNFRSAVTIESANMCEPKDGEICIQNLYVGVNAADVNISKGRYLVEGGVPYDVGFEGVGKIVELGSAVTSLNIGDAVAYLSSNHCAYAEYCCVLARNVFPIPEVKPEYLVLLVCGLSAAIGLDEIARIMHGETVLITAAAGGTGHMAVQWAKAAGCHVIGTCSSEDKEKVLKDLGCDRVINYRREDLEDVLSKEYPCGVDVIWETIGGSVFEICVKNLAVKGRLIIVGGTSGYKEEQAGGIPKADIPNMPELLLFRSAAVHGFLVLHYQDRFLKYFKYLVEIVESGKMKVICDLGKDEERIGMEGIIKGVEHMYSGKSIGKVIVKIS